ncbi:MAG: hypothetical protein QM817_38550 [Archangium sp.]
MSPLGALLTLASSVLYGTGLGSDSSLAATCDVRSERCAIIDLAGRVAIVERSTGKVLATSFFPERGPIAFDQSGDLLGVGPTEWNWRTGETRSIAARTCCVARSPNRVAWLEGPQFTLPAQLHVRGRTSDFAVELTATSIKYLLFAGDDLLLVVHTDSLDAYDLSGSEPRASSLQLEPERGSDHWRPYGGNPRVQLTATRILLSVTPTELRVLTRKLEPVRTLQPQNEAVFADERADRLARVKALDGNRVQVVVEDTDTGRQLATTEFETTSTVSARFCGDRLLLSTYGGTWLWDLRSPPAKFDDGRPLLVAGDDVLETHRSSVRFNSLDGKQPPREAQTFSSLSIPTAVFLRDDHVLIRGARLEALGPAGLQPLTDDDQRLAAGPAFELNRSVRDGEFVLESSGGRLTRVSVAKDDWVSAVTVDEPRTRAVVVLHTEWRLYDLTRGTVLRSEKLTDWPHAVASFQPGSRAFVLVDAEHVTAWSRDGKRLARRSYPLEKQDGMRGGSGEQPAADLVWTKTGVALSLWTEPDLWFLQVPSLEFIKRVPGGGYAERLQRLASGVAVFERDALALFSDDGTLRARVETSLWGARSVSADGKLVAYCSKSAVVVLDEHGKTVDGDARFCDDARALSVSRSHLAVVRRGEVRLMRRDDRSIWSALAFHPDRAIGFGSRAGDPPPPPSSLLVLEREDRFGLSDLRASPHVTAFDAHEVPLQELAADLFTEPTPTRRTTSSPR